MDLVNDSPRVLGNRYEVGELLGRGGMAEVHLGRDARLGRTVAIKLLRSDLARDPTFQARFRREAQSAAALNHPAIVAVYDTGEEPAVESGGSVISVPYIVMEHIEGRTLRDMLGDGRHLDVDAALDITTGVLTALEYSHRIGIVHRDIKPANVMLTPVGDVKVMDFGIARAMADASSTMTQTQAVIGTAQYLSPEQARGEAVDARSDLYSAGCLLFELLTGRPPFVADSPVAVAYQHVREQAPPPSRFVPSIPDSVDKIVMHALAKGREERYQSAADFRTDVESVRGGRQLTAPTGAFPAVGGAGATTQYIPPADGTRGMRPVDGQAGMTGAMPGGLLSPAPGSGGPGGGYPAPGGYGQGDDPFGRAGDEQPGKRRRGPVIAAVLIAALLAAGVLAAIMLTSGNGGADQVALPNVVGKVQAIAEKELTTAGFVPKSDKTAASTAEEKGTVLEQDPSGSKAAKGSTITLTIGAGPDTQTVPNLKGMTQDEARKALEERGLAVGNVTSEDDPEIEKDGVISSSPAAGDTVESGTSVSLVLSTGKVTVPNLIGQSPEAAHRTLTDLKLRYKDVLKESSKPAGTVIAQDETGSTKQKTRVTLTIAKPKTATTTAPTTPAPTTTSPSPSSSPSDEPT